jgi:hypothetical protein
MSVSFAAFAPLARLRAIFLIAAALLLGGCATHYVDGAVKEVPATAFARPASPHAVQLVFEFQTKVAANTRATEQVKPMVLDRLKQTGLFTDVQDKPVAGGAVLSVTINNVALTDDAYRKGFMTGLTFGLAGSTVTDGYLCTVSYLPPGATTPIVKTSKHAIHTQLGANSAPPANAYKAAGIEDAVRTMVRQILGTAMRDVSQDTAFR